MATVTYQTIIDGSRDTIIKVNIDGATDLNKTVIFDPANYVNPTIHNKIMRVDYAFDGFSGELFWDATAAVPILTIPKDFGGKAKFYEWIGGLTNNGGAGQTGKILLSTAGAGATTSGYLIIFIKKKRK